MELLYSAFLSPRRAVGWSATQGVEKMRLEGSSEDWNNVWVLEL